MDIRHLKTLIAIADCGTFGGAAHAVGLTQSAVSQQVRTIEGDLQIKLFDRTLRPPTLTPHGQALVDGARKLVSQYEQIVISVAGGRLSGRLELGAMRTSLTGMLPEALSILRGRYPQLHIHVLILDTAELPGMIMTGRIDAAIVPDLADLGDEFRWMPFAIEPLRVVAPETAVGDTDRALLESNPYIRFSRPVSAARVIDHEIRRRRIGVVEVMAIDSFAGIVMMVARGLGVSIAPQQAREHPFPDNVRYIPFGDPPLSRVIGIIDKKGEAKSEIVDVLHAELWRLSGSPDFGCGPRELGNRQ